jgi:glycosyltransferase involved in cell wall biosynthesis
MIQRSDLSKEPTVSVIIPCRNEKGYISKTLLNVLDQDYPKDKLEIWVADGMSDDGTRDELEKISKEYEQVNWIDNPDQIVPPALNACINASKGDVIVRLDAHSLYPKNYISQLVHHLIELDADNTGGVWITEPANNSSEAKAIALATSHPLGIGDSDFRLENNQVKEVETVPYGCYRRTVFEQIGLFDNDLTRNQDDEFNARLKKAGGRILLIPSVKIRYFARPNLKKMRKMFYHYGLFKPLVNIKIGQPTTIRQFIPLLFVLANIIAVVSVLFSYKLAVVLLALVWVPYLTIVSIISFKISQKAEKGIFSFLLVTFPSIHLSYGYGYLLGFGKVVKYLRGKGVGKVDISR